MQDQDKKKVGKYLTEIKELPDYKSNEDKKVNSGSMSGSKPVEKQEPTTEVFKEQPEQARNRPQPENKVLKSNDDSQLLMQNLPQAKTIKIAGIPFILRDILLNTINILTLVLLIIILTRLPDKANALKEVKNENIRLSENYNYNSEQVAEELERARQLENLFATDSKVIDFVSDVESLKNNEGVVRRVSFSSPDTIKDKSGSYGRPIIISMRGNWEQIDKTMSDIQNLPYLFRPIKIEITKPDELESQEIDIVEVNYGGLIYVEEENGKDK